ncbi:phosphoribosyl ATP pyrophosphatase [Ameyamaea chiangmaiensis NBRC 103196]|uniref:Uncharacterized protein n=1 Tax=Ameyamaea chiangmaiensis TaxID=442969 RepID=A0A850P8B1_9PROT|nr:hypothetical protein [Ameyamaea chiangmaiensis]MBS4075792.1 hypothetical protein [Ameyamaea chiangmaiensis]NVN40855.1 hypothetical protein [Ameyamaea chiangmaiensis]GBQ63760.1 phosphoribosyl ATP pyrophosphatase [Ameyamaea chiangmaiensis NBRC 103196]
MVGLARVLGAEATECVRAFVDRDAAALTDGSAAVMQTLLRIWMFAGIAEAEVWDEMDKRLRLGNLMFELNRPSNQRLRRGRRQWNVTSTKLP